MLGGNDVYREAKKHKPNFFALTRMTAASISRNCALKDFFFFEEFTLEESTSALFRFKRIIVFVLIF